MDKRRKKRKLQTREERLQAVRKTAKTSPRAEEFARRGRERKEKKQIHKVGILLAVLQAIVSAVFVGVLYFIGIIPVKYVIAAAVVLVILSLIVFYTQRRRKSRAIGGKIFSFLLIMLITLATYYVGKINGAFGQITNKNYKVDNMVVAVLKDDPAENISDAKDYTFGVQYKLSGHDVEQAVADINEKLGTEIKLEEYESVQEQAEALHDGKVKAIIYNEGYTGTLNEGFAGYEKNVKIIYRFEIKKELSQGLTKVNTKKEPFSVYISGIDVYGAIETNSRSDVNIIATVNPETHQILLVTTPRDYFVEIPGVSRGQRDKLTHAGIYGVDKSIKTLEKLYNTEIPIYARVNFTSLIDIVDQLGGLDVYSEYSYRTGLEAGKEMNVSEGMNHFNGKEALAFARERHNLPGGDAQRGKNQEAIITAIIKKMISPQMLVQAGGLIDSVSGNVETNMSQEQLQDLIKTQLEKGGSWNIYSTAAEGEGGKDYCYSASSQLLYVTYPDKTSVANISDLIKRVKNGEVLEGSEVAE